MANNDWDKWNELFNFRSHLIDLHVQSRFAEHTDPQISHGDPSLPSAEYPVGSEKSEILIERIEAHESQLQDLQKP